MPNVIVPAAARGLPAINDFASSTQPTLPLPRSEQPKNLTTTLAPWEGPEQFSMVGCGVCMQPEIMDGTPLLFDRMAPVRAGDIGRSGSVPSALHPASIRFLSSGWSAGCL